MSECFNCGRSLDWRDPDACGTGDPMGYGYETTIACLGHGLTRAKARISDLESALKEAAAWIEHDNEAGEFDPPGGVGHWNNGRQFSENDCPVCRLRKRVAKLASTQGGAA